MENHHCAVTFQTLCDPAVDIFVGLETPQVTDSSFGFAIPLHERDRDWVVNVLELAETSAQTHDQRDYCD